MAVVVVFPCVPDTAMTRLFLSIVLYSHSGPDIKSAFLESKNSKAGLPLEMELPIT